MMALLAMLKTAQFWIKAAPYLLIAAVALYVVTLRSDNAELRSMVVKTAAALATEKADRTRDVAGLTALSSGLVAASSAKQRDQDALSHAIDVQHPQPVSAGLSRLLVCLRAADQNRECSTAPGTGAGSATTAAGAH